MYFLDIVHEYIIIFNHLFMCELVRVNEKGLDRENTISVFSLDRDSVAQLAQRNNDSIGSNEHLTEGT